MSGDDLDGSHINRAGLARWLAGAAGLSAVGTIAGVHVARSMTRRAASHDPYANEDFETLDGDRSYVVTTPDGVPLAVREVGPTDDPDLGSRRLQHRTLLNVQLDVGMGNRTWARMGTRVADPAQLRRKPTR